MLRLLSIVTMVCLTVGFSYFAAAEDSKSEKTEKDVSKPTHKQVRTIKPMLEGKAVALNTMCLAANGDVLCCVGGSSFEPVVGEEGGVSYRMREQGAAVLVYSPEGEFKAALKTDFKPTAINVASDGTLFVGGEGHLLHMTREGEILKSSMSPNIGDYEEFKNKAVEEAKKQAEQFTEQFRDQAKTYEKQIAKIEAIDAAKRSASQTARLKALTRQKQTLDAQCEALKEQFAPADPESVVRQAMNITSLAVTDRDLFVCCRSLTGHGYEVWRTTHDFTEPEQVLTGLSGCCGQMDIQARGEHLFVAANTRFQVVAYDRDGKEQNAFGERANSKPSSFGGCCNPMNIRCCPNGEILAAESSIGYIKRFGADGEFLGIVGKAKIGGGCKHVAVGFDADRDAYYMMNVDKGHVCVMLPIADNPGLTEDEKAAADARAGLGKKLVGTWELAAEKPKKAQKSSFGSVLSALIGISNDESSNLPFENFVIKDDGSAACARGQYASLSGKWTWEAVQQKDDSLVWAMVFDGVPFLEFNAEFVGDDELKLSQIYADSVMWTKSFQRLSPASDRPAPRRQTKVAPAPAPA
ncbi:MAG: hypothetical protein WD065_07465, partial [Planctomycetaceae bacterium]